MTNIHTDTTKEKKENQANKARHVKEEEKNSWSQNKNEERERKQRSNKHKHRKNYGKMINS